MPQLEINPDVFDRLSKSYADAIHETKQIINAEINSKVKKSIDLKRGFRSKAQKRKHD